MPLVRIARPADPCRVSRRVAAALPLFALTLLTAPAAAEAQRAHAIGWLASVPWGWTGARSMWVFEFVQALRQGGWVEGQHFVVHYRAAGQHGSLPDLAAELVRRRVDVIVAQDEFAALAAKRATPSIPIVFALVDDPVGGGLVASLARPGGNVTGVATLFPELGSKQLELLRETVPGLARVAILWDPTALGGPAILRHIEQAALGWGITLQSLEVRQRPDLETALSALVRRRPDGLIVLFSSRIDVHTYARIQFVVREQRLPTIANYEQLAWKDVLMSYGPNQHAAFQRAAHYARRILEGARASDLPVERPTQFDLILNLNSAKALGVTFPDAVLLRATTVLK